MTEEQFNESVRKLKAEIVTMTDDKSEPLKKMLKRTLNEKAKMRSVLDEIGENVSRLRLSVQYLAFDLEATRRENQTMKDLLHKHGIDEEGK